MISKYRLRGFTLVELIATIAIVLILVTIVGNGLFAVRAKARRADCLTRIRSIGQVALLYANENKSQYSYSATEGISFGLLYDPVDFAEFQSFVCPMKSNLAAADPLSWSSTTSDLSGYTSYRYVLDQANAPPQTSYPTSYIVFLETLTDPNYDEADNHGLDGTAAFYNSGRGKFTFSNQEQPKNVNKTGTGDYNITSAKLYF